jgi:histidinol-phosphatase
MIAPTATTGGWDTPAEPNGARAARILAAVTLLERMHAWCDDADAIALRHAALTVLTETKADGTPVTVADRAIERVLRERIDRDRPGESILGEEEGGALPASGACWILDPIDGTKNFARGIPLYGTLLARWEDGVLTDAIVSAPGLGSRWWATGGAAFKDGARIQVSPVSALADADICTGGLDWAHRAGASIDALLGAGRRHRGFGDFWGHLLVAQGSMEAMIEYAPLALWDIAAPRCILEAAGGRVTDHAGDAAFKPGPVIATNGLLHDAMVAALSPPG